MKIYIIGPPGVGKTTLAKKLSQKYNIENYELDNIVFDDDNNHHRRDENTIAKLFNEIIKKDNWIIEDVGRSKFIKGLEVSDKIYYIQIGKARNYLRVLKRWIKQLLRLEHYNYPPSLAQLKDMLKVTKSYYDKQDSKLKIINEYKEKVTYLRNKELKKI